MTTAEVTRPKRLSMRRIVGPYSATPLLILFGLNAVDELDRTAFGVLLPEIRDHFGLDNQGILSVVALVTFIALGMQWTIGYFADRRSRVHIAVGGAVAWGTFSLLTGLAPALAVLIIARCGSAIGRVVNDPTHNSLLADYYPPEVRPPVYGFHRAANSFGQIVGPLSAGLLAYAFGWRVPFIVLSIPTALLVVVAFRRLREPTRGAHERAVMGADAETIATEEAPPSLAEGWRICSQVKTLKRVWLSLPFLAVSLIGLVNLGSIFYEEVFGLNEAQRGLIAGIAEPAQLVGIVIAVPIATRLFARDIGLVFRYLAIVGAVAAVMLGLFASAPNVGTAIAANIGVQAVLGMLAPGIYAALSMVIPPRARSLGYALGSLYALPGVLVLILIGGVSDASGIRTGMMLLVPVFLVGALIIASAGKYVTDDIAKVRSSTVAQAEVLAARRRGEAKLLLVRDLDVGYDGVQVLFGVNIEVDEGEIVALLGTNGAGKSTLLRAISGLTPASAGAIVFDGVDMTFAPPQDIAGRGVIQVPGGKGVFPGLTVADNIRIAGWLYQRDRAYVKQATEQVLEQFPILRARWDDDAGNLSGGEQQMLTLAQAFIAQPRLLMIDELSLGLAPVIVDQLLRVVEEIRRRGTTIILVEQSVNVALTVAERAYFMEKGQVRFEGPTADLLARPDVLRSVFLEGAAAATGDSASSPRSPARSSAATRRPAEAVRRVEMDGDTTPLLEVRDIRRSYGGIAAVAGVSFTVDRGEIVGMIGPNGAGKTTLFDLVSGFVATDGGVILFDGLDITTMGPDARARLGLGRSFQDARLFPALTVVDTVKLALERQVANRDPIAAALNLPVIADSEAKVSARADELMALMGITGFADKFVAELSTGSRRIVDLACVLAHEPDLILFDEPSSGIAQREAEALGPLLQRIRDASGAALLVIEHDMPLVTSISDRMIALDLGAVVVVGDPNEVVTHPDVVRSYLGTDDAAIARSGTRSPSPSTPSDPTNGSRRRPRRAEPLRATEES
jgi:branched-chain amino acid transport system ATP-binding protein